ncbi:lysostaphin resistance A-like protein, partial [Rhizobium brockwellii]|uniref:CPBP family intramembrane glutamic endopeptidase n=1 Tax=Rhizobium brockwellii TaxID=3019932 RepID=UPI003F966A3D
SGGATSIGLVAATVVVAPVVEVLLHRGYLLGALRERMPGFAAVLVSALLFVFVLHFEPANLVAALCLGLATGWCALRSGSLLPGIIVHMASNAFGLWYL